VPVVVVDKQKSQSSACMEFMDANVGICCSVELFRSASVRSGSGYLHFWLFISPNYDTRNHFMRPQRLFVNNEKIIYLRKICGFGALQHIQKHTQDARPSNSCARAYVAIGQ